MVLNKSFVKTFFVSWLKDTRVWLRLIFLQLWLQDGLDGWQLPHVFFRHWQRKEEISNFFHPIGQVTLFAFLYFLVPTLVLYSETKLASFPFLKNLSYLLNSNINNVKLFRMHRYFYHFWKLICQCSSCSTLSEKDISFTFLSLFRRRSKDFFALLKDMFG